MSGKNSRNGAIYLYSATTHLFARSLRYTPTLRSEGNDPRATVARCPNIFRATASTRLGILETGESNIWTFLYISTYSYASSNLLFIIENDILLTEQKAKVGRLLSTRSLRDELTREGYRV